MRRRIGEKINQKKGKIYWKNRNSRPKRRGGIGGVGEIREGRGV
jgi:hypothetical protein